MLCALAAASILADEKPLLTKEQERQKFHPRRLGKEAAARQAGFEKRLEMEKASLLSEIPVKTVKESLRRGYGENPWAPFFRIAPTVGIAYWAAGGAPVKLAVRDENGLLWKELDGTSRRGMNVVEYDLSADAKLADAAEAKARAKEKEKAEDKAKKEGDNDMISGRSKSCWDTGI